MTYNKRGGQRSGAGRPRNPGKKITISIAISPDLLADFDALIGEESRSQAIGKIIDEWIQQHENQR